jgi:hypothetical protein
MNYIYIILFLLTCYYPLLDLELVRYLYFFFSIWYLRKGKLSYSFFDLFRIVLISTCMCIFIHDIWSILWDFFISLNITSAFEIPILPHYYIPKKQLYSIGGVIYIFNINIVFVWYLLSKYLSFFKPMNIELQFKKLYYLGIFVVFFTFLLFNFIYLFYNTEVYSYIFIRDIYLSVRYLKEVA